MVETMMRKAVPLQTMEVNGGADIHLQPMEDPTPEQVEAPERGCDPMGSLRWSKFLAGPVARWREEPTLEQLRRGVIERLWWAPGLQPGSTHHSHLELVVQDNVQMLLEISSEEFNINEKKAEHYAATRRVLIET
ncbi:AN1-type zinc finger protein 5-like [Grus japonensis]|uniref:AN1-type zinc finger protein 5-like n=1 Tax=Grus japonensis TaxID=30415 RepID=A0ABC9WDC2_GRUJA